MKAIFQWKNNNGMEELFRWMEIVIVSKKML